MKARDWICGALIALLVLIALAMSVKGAPEPLQRDTATKALIQTELDLKGVTLTLGSITVSDSAGIRTFNLGTTNGTKIGATGDKMGFLGATPIVRPSSTTDLRVALINLGLYTTGGASPLNLNGGAFTASTITGTNGTLTGTLGVTGAFTGSSITLSGNETIAGTLGVTGAATLTTISGTNQTLSGTLGVTGNSTFGGTLGVTGNGTFAADISVVDEATIGGALDVTGDGTFQNNLDVIRDLSVGENLDVTNTGTLGALIVTGSSNLQSITATTYSGTSMALSGNETVGGTLGVTGAFSGSSGAFSTTLGVTGNTTIGGTLGITGATTGSSLALSGNETVGGTLGVTGVFSGSSGTFSTTLGVTGNTTLGGTLSVTSNATVGGTLGVTGASTIAALSATSGTFSSTLGVTGALTGSSGSFSSTLRGAVQDKGGAVYHVKSAAVPLVGDGTTDDTAAFQALCDVVKAAGGGTILFDKGTFRLHGKITVDTATKFTIKGAGRGATVLKSTMPVGTPVFGDATMMFFTSSSYFRIEGITFDNNNIETTNTDTSMVAGVACSHFTITDTEFINQMRHGLFLNSATHFWIERNYFQRALGGTSYLHSAILLGSPVGPTGPGWITDNEVVGTAIGGDGIDITYKSNRVISSASGAGIFVNSNADTKRATVAFNHIDGTGTTTDALSLFISGIECDAPNSIVHGNVIRNSPGIGIALGAPYQTVTDNQIIDPGIDLNPGVGIGANYQNAGFHASYTTISGNKVLQIDGNDCAYGFADVGATGQQFGIKFSNNDFSGGATAPVLIAATNTDYTFDNYSISVPLKTGDAVMTTIAVPPLCKNIRMVMQARGTRAATTDRIAMRFNADTGNNYNYQTRGDITDSGTAVGYFAVGHIPAASATAIFSGTVEVIIPNPTGSTFYKGVTALINRWYTGTPEVATLSGFWKMTSPLTSISVLGENAGFASGGTLTATYEF